MRNADPINRKHPQYEPYPSCYTVETPMDKPCKQTLLSLQKHQL